MTLRILSAFGCIALASLLTGCALIESESNPRPLGTVLKESADTYLRAKSRARLVDAMRRGDDNAIRAAGAELDRVMLAGRSPQEAAYALYQQALILAAGARESEGQERESLEARADAKYRTALQLYPAMARESQDKNLLNAIGYHLADHGKSAADFKQAEALLRRALVLWERELAQPGPGFGNTQDMRRKRAEEPLDSLAWALYKQGRYQEALKLQQEVLRVVKSTGEPQYDAALPFHLGEIYRALGKHEAARTQYIEAMTMNPPHSLANEINEAMKKLNSAPEKGTGV